MWKRAQDILTPKAGGDGSNRSRILSYMGKDDEYSKPIKVSSKNFRIFDRELDRIKNPQFNKGESIALSELNSL